MNHLHNILSLSILGALLPAYGISPSQFETQHTKPMILGEMWDSASNVIIQNNSSTPMTLNGLYIAGTYLDSGCITDPVDTYGNNYNVVLATPVPIPDNSSISVGQNYLYNLLLLYTAARGTPGLTPCTVNDSGGGDPWYVQIGITSSTPSVGRGNELTPMTNTTNCLVVNSSTCSNSSMTWTALSASGGTTTLIVPIPEDLIPLEIEKP